MFSLSEADGIRAQFRAHQAERNPAVIASLVERAERELEAQKHPDPYTFPTMPGGSKVCCLLLLFSFAFLFLCLFLLLFCFVLFREKRKEAKEKGRERSKRANNSLGKRRDFVKF